MDTSKSDWTVDTLKAHVEAIFAEREQRYEQRFHNQEQAVKDAFFAQRSAIDAALASADRAVQKAEASAEARFASVNEFRNTLKDQQSGLLSRTEADAEFRAIRDKIDALTTRLDRQEGRGAGMNAGWIYLLGAVGLLASIIAIALAFLR